MTAPVRRTSGGRGAMVPPVEVRTYYDQPVIKPPVWTWEVPTYFFVGGLGGASSVLAVLADLRGERRLARVARLVAAGAGLASPPLLISDLGRPERFLNMLRVFRPTSPMSMGSWLLAAYGPAAVVAAGLDRLSWFPRLRNVASVSAAGFGPGLVTYTGVLLADTSVPVWHEAHRELPAVFAASAMASAGAVGLLAVPDSDAARAVALTGAVAELVAVQAMERRLGDDLGKPYDEGRSGLLAKAATACTTVGAGLLALGGRRAGRRGGRRGDRGRGRRAAGAVLVLAGAVLERAAVFTAGRASALDPTATIRPQRARLDAGHPA